MVNEIPPNGASFGTGGIDSSTTDTTTPTVNTTSLDTMSGASAGSESAALNLLDQVGRINLSQGRISIVEFQQIINETIHNLKNAITDAQQVSLLAAERFRLSTLDAGNRIQSVAEKVQKLVTIEEKAIEVAVAYDTLLNETAAFNSLLENTYASDLVAVNQINAVITTYNNLTPTTVNTLYNNLSQAERDALLSGLTQAEIDDLGGEEYAVVFQQINQKITNYNDYLSARPDIQAAVDSIIQATIDYNAQVEKYNADVDEINILLVEINFPPLPHLDTTPVPDPQPYAVTLPAQPNIIPPLIPSNATERLTLFLQPPTDERTLQFKILLAAIDGVTAQQVNTAFDAAEASGPFSTEAEFFGLARIVFVQLFSPPSEGLQKFDQVINEFPMRYTLTLPDSSQIGKIPIPINPGNGPDGFGLTMVNLFLIPNVQQVVGFLARFNRLLELGFSQVYEEIYYLSLKPQNLTLPFGHLDTINPVFTASSNSIGGIGLASSAIGLHSRNLEIVLSRTIFRAVAAYHSLPISGRLFARLQFSALELLSKSSLKSSIPAVNFLASKLGSLDPNSNAINAVIALAFAGQIGNLASADLQRVIVNGQVNRLSFFAREKFREANLGLRTAQQDFDQALSAGDPSRLASAVDQLAKAQVQLANATGLLNAFGPLSIGNIAAFTNQAAATLNLSLLGISTALFARALGIPNLVPLVFAQTSQLSPKDLLVALNPGPKILDVLENPISLLFIKQSLSDTLSRRLGYPTSLAAAIVNHAINNLVYSGIGLNTLSSLKNSTVEQFKKEGIAPLDANLLANETVALIRGDLGAQFLNAAFGINVDPSLISAAIVNQLFETDREIAGKILSSSDSALLEIALNDAINRALASQGTFRTQREFRDSLRNELQGAGFNINDALFLANSASIYGQGGNLLSPLGISDAQLEAINQSLTGELRHSGLSNSQADSIIQEAYEQTKALVPFLSPDDFYSIYKEEFFRSLKNQAGNVNGNYLFDLAASGLRGSSDILGLPSVINAISSAAQRILNSDLGGALANKLGEQILISILGGRSTEEISNEERRNPVSLLNQIQDQLKKLRIEADEADQLRMRRKLIQLLEKLSIPNAEIGFLLSTIQDNAGTFFGAANVSKAGENFQPLQIPI